MATIHCPELAHRFTVHHPFQSAQDLLAVLRTRHYQELSAALGARPGVAEWSEEGWHLYAVDAWPRVTEAIRLPARRPVRQPSGVVAGLFLQRKATAIPVQDPPKTRQTTHFLLCQAHTVWLLRGATHEGPSPATRGDLERLGVDPLAAHLLLLPLPADRRLPVCHVSLTATATATDASTRDPPNRHDGRAAGRGRRQGSTGGCGARGAQLLRWAKSAFRLLWASGWLSVLYYGTHLLTLAPVAASGATATATATANATAINAAAILLP